MNSILSSFLANAAFCFRVWAPQCRRMQLHLLHPRNEWLEMDKNKEGYFSLTLSNVVPGTRYFFKPDDGAELPDPASQFQPEGVHGPSEVVDHRAFTWNDAGWRGLPLQQLVLYELHVGTFTPEGSFEAIIPRLDDLKQTGINALELMPVAQFPGARNWGYDAVYPYAVQNSYGGPTGLKKLVDACHQKGIAVFLDVVYNHIGPEGNYFKQYGPYFTDKYHTPWGDAINMDGEWSDGVRDYFSHNPNYWFEQYHIDGLRLDAIHTIFDNGAVPFWELLYQRVKTLEKQLNRPLYLTAESDLNSPRVIRPPREGGFGFDAQWLDDFHHALYVLLDENGRSRYVDFGTLEQLAKAYNEGFVHSGEFVSFRKRKYGASSAGIDGHRFIAFNQNHDQVGNRVGGERLTRLVSFERLKLAAAALLLAPYVPLLFMGEEYGEKAPFFYFVSHSEEALIRAVQEGRKKEFGGFGWETDPPDPQAEKTFRDCTLNWHLRHQGAHSILLRWYRGLLELRQQHPALQDFCKKGVQAHVLPPSGLLLHRQHAGHHLYCLFNFGPEPLTCELPLIGTACYKLLDAADAHWNEAAQDAATQPDRLLPGDVLTLPVNAVVLYEAGGA